MDVLGKFHNSDLHYMGQISKKIEQNFTPEIAANKIFEAFNQTYNSKK